MVEFRKMRLTGFKSFVEATEMEIGQGLTGIVGPNGCGKSNLVEALRWVMGENSPKRMRSSGMDDVIFNGTEQRPARNTAEVVLLMGNEDHTAPAEFNESEELEVSRKIEREVGSVYKVNGKNVRMRDVQLLFADSAIGAHSPGLVSQGRVSDMINAKPQQRRMVLEEAAGVSGLHARRHEAEIKLKAAETNLLRVEDVLGAMNLQLESLKKQARQASRYRNLSGHIQAAEGNLLWFKWQGSDTAVAAAIAAFSEAESIVHDRTHKVAILTRQQTEAAAYLPQLRQAEAEAAAVLQRFKLAYGSLETEERQVAEERTKSENLLQQFTNDIAHENTQKEEAGQNVIRLKGDLSALQAASTQQTERENEAEILRDETSASVERLETDLATLTEDVALLEASHRAVENKISDNNKRLNALTAKKEGLDADYAAIIGSTPARAELDDLGSQISSFEEKYQASLAAFDSAEEARTTAEEHVQKTQESLRDLQKIHGGLVAEADGLRRLLKNQQEGYQPVLDLLNVDAGLEKALAVALGDDLQAALDGSAPMFWRELPGYETTLSLPGSAQPLSSFVKGPQALNRALSQIGVVETASEAESLMGRLQPGQCLVTKEGGAWRWDGFVVSAAAENASAIKLQQKNRLADLETAIASSQEEVSDAQHGFESAKLQRDEVIATASAARQAFRSTEETLNGLRKRYHALSHQLTEVTARISGITTSLENTIQEIEITMQKLEEARAEQSTLEDPAQKREKIINLKTALGAERTLLADRQAIFADIRREGENRARQTAQTETDIESWTQRGSRIDIRVAELQERVNQSREVLERLASRPAEIEREKQDLLTHIHDAEQKRTHTADVLIKAENLVNDLSRDLRIAETSLSDAREQRAMAQGRVETVQQAQEGIKASILEKFSCTPEEMVAKLELDTALETDLEQLQSKLDRLVRERDNMGPVNLRAEAESDEITQKMTAMQTERDDLVAAIGKLREGIAKLNKEARERLLTAFDEVNAHFQRLFTRLFNGGQAHLKLIEADDPLESGLEIYAQPPGKKLQVLSLLSGGEQTLTAIALIFAMFLTNPAPLCVLDEVDAPLDESNVDRYCTLLEDLAKDGKTRFVVVTHHRMTMARMDRLYGVTMSEKGVSQLVSVDLKQHSLDLEQAA